MKKHVHFQLYRAHRDALLRKPDNWREIYLQTSTTFYTLNDVYLKLVDKKKLLGCQKQGISLKNCSGSNHYEITVWLLLKKIQKQPPEVFYKKALLKNFEIFTGKDLCWSLFLILNAAKFLRAPILKYICERPLL